ncbi:hypothetical protein CYMTET_15763 [Cymbomonas tetramitiformis]|uniref:Uncharacterized protein n=1 Tax=Cymbomonas tetramitiformis TaxID=36881 RepID=A0AAE0GDS5_9CHLO|nr:hypothetical protein CYMTET_15763 [Cymbomonas tetramitiformis]
MAAADPGKEVEAEVRKGAVVRAVTVEVKDRESKMRWWKEVEMELVESGGGGGDGGGGEAAEVAMVVGMVEVVMEEVVEVEVVEEDREAGRVRPAGAVVWRSLLRVPRKN